MKIVSLFTHHFVPRGRILQQLISKQNIMEGIVQPSSFTHILVIPNLYWQKSEDIFWRKLVINQFWWSLISITLTFDFHCAPYWSKTRENDDRSFFFLTNHPFKTRFLRSGWLYFWRGFKIHFCSLNICKIWPWNNLWVIITSLGLNYSSNFPSWHKLHHGPNSQI